LRGIAEQFANHQPSVLRRGSACLMRPDAFECGLDAGCYFERPPERLVLEGYRRWLAGFETGSVVPWEMTQTLYDELLGPAQGRHVVAELSHFVRTLRRCAACPLKSFPFNAHNVCRDECLALGLIAALQHDDEGAAQTCLSAIACPALSANVAEAAATYADALAGARHYLLPIPLSAIEDVLARSTAGRGTVH
jgi:hypothetical protein